jgi:hypothetical protein
VGMNKPTHPPVAANAGKSLTLAGIHVLKAEPTHSKGLSIHIYLYTRDNSQRAKAK